MAYLRPSWCKADYTPKKGIHYIYRARMKNIPFLYQELSEAYGNQKYQKN